MNYINEMTIRFKSLSVNEGFARSAVSAFCVGINPSLDDIIDIKTAVSEAVTNCVVHAYPNKIGEIEIWVGLTKDAVFLSIKDWGVGIDDLKIAREPFFTTKPDEDRAGMGFTVMESFMDGLEVLHNPEGGIEVKMKKKIFKKSMEQCKIND